MRVFISGAAGFIGSHLAERLAGDGHDVIGLDSFSDYYDRHQKDHNAAAVRAAGAQLVEADLVTTDLTPWVEGAEVIYHVAAQPGISAATPFSDYLNNNLKATHAVLTAASAQLGLKLFVNVSTSSVYGRKATEPETVAPEPVSYYGVTKLAAEQLVMAYHRNNKLPACSLRLFSVYGPRERPDKLYPRLIRSILYDEAMPLFQNSREHSRSFTYVGDVIDAFISVLGNDACLGEIINIGSDVEIKIGQAIDIVESLLGKPALVDLQPNRPGDQQRTCADIGKARRLLGFEPRTIFEEGIKHEIAWMRELLEKQGR
jgi:UDP-glucuronate 4-epimerase